MSLAMLWGSQAEAVVLESFRRAKWSAEADRKVEAERRLDVLEDDWGDILWDRIRQIYKSTKVVQSVRHLISTEHNVAKRIARELSTVYKQPATREVQGAEQNRLAKLLWKETRIDSVLDLGNLYTNSLRDLLLVPRVHRGRMKIDILTPDRVSVIQDPGDPTEAVGFWYERTLQNTPSSTDIEVVYADLTEWRFYKKGEREPYLAFEHGLGRLPATVVHADERRETFWGPSAFSDVFDANIMIGVLMVMLMRLGYLQSELQPTYSGRPSEIARPQEVGGDNLWVGPGTWGVLNLQADPEHYIKHINARIGWIAQQYGLAADVYNLTASGTSGFQIRLKRLPLYEARQKQKTLWTQVERDLWILMANVAQREHPILRGLDPMAEFTVNHGDEPMIEDPAVESRILSEKVKAGRMSPYDVLMHDDPDLSRDQARAKAQRIAEERAEWVQHERELGITANPMEDGPGKSQEENGADGARARGRGDDQGDEDIDRMARAALRKIRGK